MQAGQSGETCDTQKELFDFIKEERESSRILTSESIDLREKVLSQQQQIESITLANRLLSRTKYQILKRIMILNLDGMYKEIDTMEGQ